MSWLSTEKYIAMSMSVFLFVC